MIVEAACKLAEDDRRENEAEQAATRSANSFAQQETSNENSSV